MQNCKSFYHVVCFIQLYEAGVLSVSIKMDKIEYRAVIHVILSLVVSTTLQITIVRVTHEDGLALGQSRTSNIEWPLFCF